MPFFRDMEGNQYEIPAEDLARYLLPDELPEHARLTGLEVPPPAPAAPQPSPPPAPRYAWQAISGPGGMEYRIVPPPAAPPAPAYVLVPCEAVGLPGEPGTLFRPVAVDAAAAEAPRGCPFHAAANGAGEAEPDA